MDGFGSLLSKEKYETKQQQTGKQKKKAHKENKEEKNFVSLSIWCHYFCN